MWGGYVYSGFSDETRRRTVSGSILSRMHGNRSLLRLFKRALALHPVDRPRLPIWGGAQDPNHRSSSMTCRIRPRTDSWPVLPSAPISERAGFGLDGRELLVWGTAIRAQGADIFEGPPCNGARTIPRRMRGDRCPMRLWK